MKASNSTSVIHRLKAARNRLDPASCYFEDAEMNTVVTKMLRTVNATIDRKDRQIVSIKSGPVNGGLVAPASNDCHFEEWELKQRSKANRFQRGRDNTG